MQFSEQVKDYITGHGITGNETTSARLFMLREDLQVVTKLDSILKSELRSLSAGGSGNGAFGMQELIELASITGRLEQFKKNTKPLDTPEANKEYKDTLLQIEVALESLTRGTATLFANQFRSTPSYLNCLGIKEIRTLFEGGKFSLPENLELQEIQLSLDLVSAIVKDPLKTSLRRLRENVDRFVVESNRSPLEPPIRNLSNALTELRASKGFLELIELDKLHPRLKIIPKDPKETEVEFAPELDRLCRFSEICQLFKTYYPGKMVNPADVLKKIGEQIQLGLRVIDGIGLPVLLKAAVSGASIKPDVIAAFNSKSYIDNTRNLARKLSNFSSLFGTLKIQNGLVDVSNPKNFTDLQKAVKALAPELFAKTEFKSATQELYLLDILRAIESLDPTIKSDIGLNPRMQGQLKVLSNTLTKGVFVSESKIDREIERELAESTMRFSQRLGLSSGRFWTGAAICGALMIWGNGVVTGSYGGDFNAWLGGGGIYNGLIGVGMLIAPLFIMQRAVVDPVANSLIKEIKRIPEDIAQKIVDVQKDNVLLWQDLKSIERTFKYSERALIGWLEMLLPEEYIKPIIDKWNDLAGRTEQLLDQEIKLMTPSERRAKLEELQAGGGSLPNIQEFLDWLDNYLSERPTYGCSRALLEEAVPAVKPVLRYLNLDAKGVYQGANISELLVKRTFNNLIGLKREYAALKYPLGDDFIRGVAQRVVKEIGEVAAILKTQRDNAGGRTVADMLLARWVPAVVIGDSLTFGRRKDRGAQQS